jgi:hypothetical protein
MGSSRRYTSWTADPGRVFGPLGHGPGTGAVYLRKRFSSAPGAWGRTWTWNPANFGERTENEVLLVGDDTAEVIIWSW